MEQAVLEPQERDGLIHMLSRYHRLTEDETIIFAALFDAAERGLPCPTGEDLNELTGYTSDSASRYQVSRLEAKGLVNVERAHKSRVVTITSTRKATLRPDGFGGSPVTPRGTHDETPLAKAIDDLCEMLAVEGNRMPDSLTSLLKLEMAVVRTHELINRRKPHFLLRGAV